MTITVKWPDGTCYTWALPVANAIDKMIAAIAANTADWCVIEIKITKLGELLCNK